MRLILIGNVRLKYVALAIVVIDVLTGLSTNPGGTFAHIGGAFMGGLYVHLLQRGTDLTEPLQRIFGSISGGRKPKKKAPMKVVYNRKSDTATYEAPPKRSEGTQEQIDQILDKINAQGYDSLSKEEKDFLYRASKDN